MTSIIFILILFNGCSQNKTNLTDHEKGWNPYSKGQKLIFETRTGLIDSILIKDITFGFPDGLGVIDKYEILKVNGERTKYKNERLITSPIFTVHAATIERSSRIKFGISIKDSEFYSEYYDIDYLMELPEEKVSVLDQIFDDVIKIENINDDFNIPNAIEFVYWSKSKGYIRLDEYDGTIWQLKEIK